MNEEAQNLTRSAIAIVALCHEYCVAAENASESLAREYTKKLLGLLPRIYITVFDYPEVADELHDFGGALEEAEYDEVRERISALYGQYDTFLDAQNEDMRYSEAPIAASLSELLTDLYQVFYDFTSVARELPAESISGLVSELSERFKDYWSETLCSAQKVLNSLYQSGVLEEEIQD